MEQKMQYRDLGKTGLKVSAVGLGCGILHHANTDVAVRILERAFELGVTYYDTARGYGDSEIKMGVGLQGIRSSVIISSKTGVMTREEAWRGLHESLERLRTDYLDNCHIHNLKLGQDIDQRLGPGGALEALIEAKEQGIIRHIGCTAHRSDILLEALRRFDFEIILVPMNIIEREPLQRLIPVCQEKGVGVTIMKPLATGVLPATLALKWLVNQPIATCVPGAGSLAEVEENSQVGRCDMTLSADEKSRVEQLRAEFDRVRCRNCDLCLPCPVGLDIPYLLATDVMPDHLRNMGRERFRAFPWEPALIERSLAGSDEKIAALASCTRCGDCEARCPHGLQIMDRLAAQVPIMKDLRVIYQEMLHI